jgi:putative ATP-dependent endonuclease of OLD family
MYLSQLMIRNFRLFGSEDPSFTLDFTPGVTALVGENDSGKTAVVDAIRYALLTRDMEYIRVLPSDFHVSGAGDQASEIVIRCKLSGLSSQEKGAFAEHLTYEDGEVALYIYWRARNLMQSQNSRRVADVSVRSGHDGAGPNIELAARQLLAAAYLKPLRDAKREMSPGPGSRLSQVLMNFPDIAKGSTFVRGTSLSSDEAATLSLAGMAAYFRHLVDQHEMVSAAEKTINAHYLSQLALSGENLQGSISYSQSDNEMARLRQILERLQLDLMEGETARGLYGLGSHNLLYMACELLLLGKESDGLPLLLIEEPEAHLQPQRQLRLMEFLLTAAGADMPDAKPVQVIVTTHSPNLASKVPLHNVVLLDGRHAYSMAEEHTRLEKGDYRFLERFLDVTKANLFFARGVIIVEGDAEAILIPALAELVGRGLTERGVSIVNVGGTGLRRYARIFQRADTSSRPPATRVACLADMDVMPDCAPQILGLVAGAEDEKWTSPRRRWHAMRDFAANGSTQADQLQQRRVKLAKGDSQNVRTFVSDQWTLEYDLCHAGLAKEVFIAARLAKNDEPLNDDRKSREEVERTAKVEFDALRESNADHEVLCSTIYRPFVTERVSKAVAAQYLVELLVAERERNPEFGASIRGRLPRYIAEAIDFATRTDPSDPTSGRGVADV